MVCFRISFFRYHSICFSNEHFHEKLTKKILKKKNFRQNLNQPRFIDRCIKNLSNKSNVPTVEETTAAPPPSRPPPPKEQKNLFQYCTTLINNHLKFKT